MEHYLPELSAHKKRKSARTLPAHPQEILRAARRHKHAHLLPLPPGSHRNEVLAAFADRATHPLPTPAEQHRWKTRNTDAVNADWWEDHIERVLAQHRVQRDIAKLTAAVDAVIDAALVLSGFHHPAAEADDAADNDADDRARLFRMQNHFRGAGMNAQVMQIANNNTVHAENARGAAPAPAPAPAISISSDDDMDPLFTVIISLPPPCDNVRSSIPCEYATTLQDLIAAGVAAGPAFLRGVGERVLTCLDEGRWEGVVDEYRWGLIKMEAARAVEPGVWRMEMGMAMA